MTKNQIWILGGVAFYMLAMLLIGYWASKRVKNARDYIVAGGRLGWMLSVGTIFATWFGAETCMGSSGTAFKKGILGVIVDPFGAGLCLIISGLFFAKYFRKLNIETIVDYFEMRYGKRVSWFLGLIYIPVYLGWIGAQLLAFGYILNSLTGLSLVISILISTAVVIIYTYSGGMWADTMTDLFQGILLIVGLLILFPILIKDIGGLAFAKANTPREFLYFYPHSTSRLDWLNYFQAWIIVGLGSLPAQDLFQRTMAAKSAKVAKWASILSGVLYIVIGLMPVFLGIFGRLAFKESSGENILIELSLRYLSAPLVALMVGALLSAIMSSADSALLAPASIIGHNIIPSLKPDASEELQLKWCKLGVPLLAVLSLALALYFKNIYKLCQESWGVLLVGLVAPMIAGVYWKKANTQGAIAGAIGGVVAWILFKIFTPENFPHNLFGFAVSCAVLCVVSLLTQKTKSLLEVTEKSVLR
ncbi:MAG: sodium:solute symporter family protein [Candidatus Omnitrophota bacterium]